MELYAALLTTPELDAIRARRTNIDRIFGEVRNLQDEMHVVRCTGLHATGDAAAALLKREAELEAKVAELKGSL